MISGSSDSFCGQVKDTNELLKRLTRDDNIVALIHIDGATHFDLISGKDLTHIDRFVIPSLVKYTKKPE